MHPTLDPTTSTPSLFVGRRTETARLEAALGDVLGGRGRLVMLVGEPGIGKTRTAEHLAEVARQREVTVLVGRCHEGPGAPAYWPWRQIGRAYLAGADRAALATDLADGAADVGRVVDDLHDLFPDLATPPALEPDEARFRFFDAFASFLYAAARRQPLAIVLDDLHWADLASLHLLQFVARAMGAAPLLIVGTCREVESREDAARAEALGSLGRERLYERVALRGLSVTESATLVAALVGRAPAENLAHALHQRTEGNPFFLLEVTRHLDEQGLLASDAAADAARMPSVPESVRAVVRQRMRRLRPETLRLLDAAAVLGREFPLPALAAMARTDERSLLPALTEAVATGLIEPLAAGSGEARFAHALVRDALYDALPLDARADAHHRAARALKRHWDFEQDEHARELAIHLLRSAASDDRKRAVDLAVRAAARAAAAVAHEDAINWYRIALDALAREQPSDPARACQLLLALGSAQAAVSEMAEMRSTFRRAADLARRLGDGEALAHAAIGFSRVPVLQGTVDGETVALLEEALAALPSGDGTLRASALSMLAYAQQYAAGMQEERAALCREASDIARRLGDLRTLARTFYDLHSALFAPDTLELRLDAANELLELARRTDDRPMLLRARYCRIIDLIEVGRLPEADVEIDALDRLAAELREPWHHWYAAWFRASRALMDGRFADAEALAQQAYAHGERVAPELALQVLGVQISMLRAMQGRWGEMIPAIRNLVEEFPGIAAWRCALAQHAAQLGLEDEARRHFEVLAGDDFASIPRDGSWFISVSQMANVCAHLGDPDRAAALYDLLLPYRGRLMIVSSALACSGAGAHYLGVLARTMGRWDSAIEHFRDAREIHERLGLRPWVAMTQFEYARCLVARDAPRTSDQAHRALAEAAELAEPLDMAGLLDDIRALGGISCDSTSASGAVATPRPAKQEALNLFRKEGDFWTVEFDGTVCRLKDALGLRYLAQLLRHPGQEFHVTELAALAAAVPAAAQPPEGLSMRARSSALPGLDRLAQRAYRERFADLQRDLEQAERDNDPGAASRAQGEMEMLANELSGAKRTSDAGERARTSVTKRIKAALVAIRAAHPALARHLVATIKTGYFCRYAPDPRHPIDWHT